ncbi:MAG: hypothetical protein K2Y37_09750 [Pirellulales bacterium]|nr:hypothetical protein [Pirellulales bacterium]
MPAATKHPRFQFSLRTLLLGTSLVVPGLYALGLSLDVEAAALALSLGLIAAIFAIFMAVYLLLFMIVIRAIQVLLDLAALVVSQFEPLTHRPETVREPRAGPPSD